MRKKLNPIVCVEFRILVEKWYVYEGHIFPRPLLQTCRLETISLCLNKRLRVKNIQILIIFIEIDVNVCLLCAPHVMKSIILHTRRPVNKKSVTRLFLCFGWLSFFAFWEAEKHVFHIAPFPPKSYVLITLKCLDVSNRERNWKKVKTSFSCSGNLNYANWKC